MATSKFGCQKSEQMPKVRVHSGQIVEFSTGEQRASGGILMESACWLLI